MITVSIGVLKNKMLEYFRNIERTGEELIITDHRKPVLKVIPIKNKKTFKEIFAQYQGKSKFFGTVTKPETEEWGEMA